MDYLPIGFPEEYLVRYCERRSLKLLRLAESSISDAKQIGLRRGGSRWHIHVIFPAVNTEGQH